VIQGLKEGFTGVSGGLPFRHKGADLRKTEFGFPDDKSIDESAQGFRVERTGAPGDHQRMLPASFRGPERYVTQVQHGENIGEGQFVGQGETENIKAAQGGLGFQCGKGRIPFPQEGLEVHCWQEDPLGGNSRGPVQTVVEKTQAEVGHPDLVQVGECHANVNRFPVPGRANSVQFITQVAGRLLHQGQEG
jgi:hypothetical protein